LWQGRLATQAPEIDGVSYITDFNGSEARPGEIRKMRISEAYDYDLAGALIDSPETAAPGLRASPFPILAAPRGQTAPVAR
jgi:ribosomal protein S12 methylthiotransferase